jgi:excinuclease UvrABC nuclease subunit
MREALTRRCARIVAGEYPSPDLLVIDGGKGQVAVAPTSSRSKACTAYR